MTGENSHSKNTLPTGSEKINSGFKVPDMYFESLENNVLTMSYLQSVQSNECQPFKEPEQYFELFDDIVMARLLNAQIKTVQDVHPDTEYFENIEDRVMQRLNNEQKKIRTFRRILPWAAPLAVAASLIFFIFLNLNTGALSFESLATSEIEQSLDDGSIELNYTGLLNLFEDIDLQIDDVITTITDEELQTYLAQEELEDFYFD